MSGWICVSGYKGITYYSHIKTQSEVAVRRLGGLSAPCKSVEVSCAPMARCVTDVVWDVARHPYGKSGQVSVLGVVVFGRESGDPGVPLGVTLARLPTVCPP